MIAVIDKPSNLIFSVDKNHYKKVLSAINAGNISIFWQKDLGTGWMIAFSALPDATYAKLL